MLDVIGMVLFVSSMGYKDGFYNRRIPVRNIVLLDDTYVYLMILSYLNDSKFLHFSSILIDFVAIILSS